MLSLQNHNAFFRKFFGKMTLLIFALFMSLGGFARFLTLPGFSDNISFIEIILYAFATFTFCLFPFRKKDLIFVFSLALFLGASFIQGTFFNSFSEKSFLYAIRLFLLLITSYTLGKIFFEVFKQQCEKVIKWFIHLFVLIAIESLILFYFFPNTALLWVALKSLGIIFNGDPHQGRLISIYFDPNFYGAIILFPILLCHEMRGKKQKNQYLICYVLLITTLILTFSRSAISSAILLMGMLLWGRLISEKTLHFKWRSLLGFFFLSGFFFIFYFDSIAYFFERSFQVLQDPSAYMRFESASEAWAQFVENPLLGIGYNYYPVIIGPHSSPDSSLLFTLVSFGLTGTLIITYFIKSFLHSFFYALSKKEEPFWYFGKSLKLYLMISIFFISVFNNLLYYPYWLMPVFSFFTYLFYALKHEDNHRCYL